MATLSPLALELRPEQLRAVESLAPRIAVAAGPRSGKTRVVFARIARAIRTGGLLIDLVLAITFSIHAAPQIKGRLLKAFPPEQGAPIESAAISTIHSFCASLLRQYPVEAEVDPAFRILEEIEADVLKAGVMDALLDRMAVNDPSEFAAFIVHIK